MSPYALPTGRSSLLHALLEQLHAINAYVSVCYGPLPQGKTLKKQIFSSSENALKAHRGRHIAHSQNNNEDVRLLNMSQEQLLVHNKASAANQLCRLAQ